MYPQGYNRLFYQSQKKEQCDVTVKIISPSLKTNGHWPMFFVEERLYYIDVWFRYLGSYMFYVFENDIQTHQNILVVSRNEHIIYPDIERMVY